MPLYYDNIITEVPWTTLTSHRLRRAMCFLDSTANRYYGILDAVMRYTVCESVGDHVLLGRLGIELLSEMSDSLWTGPEWAMKPLSIRELKIATFMYELICNGIVQI
jgi:hypothetical protein